MVVQPEPGGEVGRLFERDRELARIDRHLAAARAGDGQLMLIEGPAGVGKSCLMGEARAMAQAAGLTVLSARAGVLESNVPFGVVRQLFGPLLAQASSEELEQLLHGAGALAKMALDPDAARAGGDASGDRGAAVLHGLYWLCANAAEHRPLLLAVDDAHWSDPGSLALLAHLGARAAELPILIMVAARSAEPGAATSVLAQMAADASAERIPLRGLGRAAVAALIEDRLGCAPDDEFVEACRDSTGGNPFLLRAALQALEQEGVAPLARAADRILELGPDSVAEGVAARLHHLPAGASDIARAVALLGGRAELRDAAALAGVTPQAAGAIADALIRADILAPGRPLEFIHPIVRQAIYGRMPEAQRSQGHARAARLLEEAGAALDHVAVQLLATEPAGDAKTVSTLQRAARAALARGALQPAIAYFRGALREGPGQQQRGELLLELGLLESRCGDPASLEHLGEAAEIASEPRDRASALRQLAHTLILAGQIPAVADAFGRAIATVADVDPDMALELEADFIATGQMGIMPVALTQERLAKLDGRAIGDATAGERLLLGVLAFEAIRRNEPADVAAALAARALSARPLTPEAILESPPQALALTALTYADSVELTDRVLKEVRDVASARGSHAGFMIFSTFHAHLSLRGGALRDALEEASAGLEAAQLYGPGFQLFAAGTACQVHIARGELEQAATVLERLGVLTTPADELLFEEPLYARGRLALARGDARSAVRDLLCCGQRLLAGGSCGVGPYPWRSRAALAHWALGEAAAARRLIDEELELAATFATPRTIGIAQHARGLVQPGEGQIDLLLEAVATLRSSPARLELSVALVDLGAAMRRSGRRVDARTPLGEGRELAVRCGAQAVAARAAEEIAAAGGRPRRLMLTGVEALTTSQVRAAQMAVQGLANPEIAQALFVSRKTVEMHLSRAYRTLGISSRNELAAALGGERPPSRNLTPAAAPAPRAPGAS